MNRTVRKARKAIRVVALLLPVLALVSLLFGAGPYDLRLEVSTNQAIPGEDRRIEYISHAVTNRTGEILFLGWLADTTDWPARFGLFLKQAGALQKVIADGDPLPDGVGNCDLSSSNFPLFDLNENGALLVVIPSQGILIRESSELKWAVRRGAAIQGTSLTVGTVGHYPFTYRERPIKPFLGNNGQVAFQARLSDASSAVLLSSKTGIIPLVMAGAPIPGRTTAFGSDHQMNQVRVKGDAVTFDLGGESGTTTTVGIFQYSGGALRTVALVGDQIPQIGTIKAIWEFESNSDGDVALAVDVEDPSKQTRPQILTWSASKGLAKLLDSKSVPGWTSAAPSFLTVISLDDSDRLFFTAANLTSGGIYLSEHGIVEKIVADGDPSPLGGRLTVTPRIVDSDFGMPTRLQYETAANGELEIAFMASSAPVEVGMRPFVWSRGWLFPVGPAVGEAEPQTGRLMDQLSIKSLADGGRLIVRGSLCCDGSSALFSVEPAEPAVSYIPFIALSSYGAYYLTYVDLVNHSPFPAYVTLEPFPPDNFPGRTVFPQSVFLQPGEAFRSALGVVPGSADVRAGYLRVTTEGGARVSAEATVELLLSSTVQSQTKLAASGTTHDALIQLDSAAGGTALALSNPGKTGAQIQMELVDDSGQARGVRAIECPPERQVVFLLSDYFKDLSSDFRGTVRLRSQTPFLVEAMSMAGVNFAGLPAQTVSRPTAREWNYANLYPGIVRQVVASEDGTVAFVTGDYSLRVVRDGQVYDPLLGEAHSLRPFGSEPWILGYLNNELVFLATEAPSLVEAVFSWKPGRLKQLFGPTTVLPDGTRISYSISPTIALTKAGLFVPMFEEPPGSGVVTAFYRFDGVFRRLCALPTPAGQTRTPSIERLTARNADFAFVASYNDYHELWCFSSGQLTKVTDSKMVLPGADRATSFGQVEVGPTGKVYFRAFFENPGDPGTRAGLFWFDGQRIEKIALEGEPVPGFPKVTFASPTQHERFRPVFAVNANDQLVFQAGLQGKPNSRGDCFLLVEPGESDATVIVPGPQALESGDWSPLPNFIWTDDGRLFFTRYRSGTGSLDLWEKGAVTTVVGPTIPLDSSPEAGFSFSSRPFGVYFPVGGQPLLGLYVSGSQPSGLYKGVAGNYFSFVFPTVVRAADGPVIYDSVLSVHNTGTHAAKAILSLIDASGIVKSRRAFDLSGGETKTIDMQDIGTFTGWARLEVTGGEVVAEETVRFLLNNEFISEVHLPPAVPGRLLSLASGQSSDVLSNPRAERVVAVALVNPYHEQQEINVELIGPGMEVKRQAHLLLPANGQKSVFLSELVGVAKAPDWIRIRSPWPVAATAISFRDGTMGAHSVWR